MKTLHLTLKYRWFKMILNGVKKEEYREIKSYWTSRLTDWDDLTLNTFDQIIFKNGYHKNAPIMTVECKGIEIGMPNMKWCDKNENCFIIKLGNIISKTNCENI